MLVQAERVTINTSWEDRLDVLMTFIRNNDCVRVTPTVVSIPQTVRSEFYDQVDTFLASFVRACPDVDLDKALVLGRHFQEVNRGLIEKTNLHEIALPHSLKCFFEDPIAAVSKNLYMILFDLVQGKISKADFCLKAEASVRMSMTSLGRCGYEMWLFLRLVQALDPIRFWSVDFGDGLEPIIQDTLILRPGHQQPLSERRIPDSAFETKDGTTYALKFESVAEVGYYDVPISRRRDNTFAGNTKQLVGQRVMMVFQVPDFNSLPTIADRDTGNVVPPQLAIEVSSERELSITASRLALGNRALTLVPHGAYVVVLPDACDGQCWFAQDYAAVEKVPNFKFVTGSYENTLINDIAETLKTKKEN